MCILPDDTKGGCKESWEERRHGVGSGVIGKDMIKRMYQASKGKVEGQNQVMQGRVVSREEKDNQFFLGLLVTANSDEIRKDSGDLIIDITLLIVFACAPARRMVVEGV